jgi:ribosomal-protein-alanine N-acetyltransferase
MTAPETAMFQVRAYRPEDFDQLVELDRQCFVPEIAYSAEEIRYFIETKDAIVLVAERDGTIGGFLIAQLYRGRATFQARILTIDVAPPLQRHKLGSLLMDAGEEEMRRRQVSQVRLEVSVNNAAAQAFYQRYGYRVIGRLPEYYPTGEDAWSMQKRL